MMRYRGLENYILLFLSSIYFITLLFPVIKSMRGIPSENYYIYIWLITLIVLKPTVIYSREFVFSGIFLIIHLFYLLIGNYELLNLSVVETQSQIFIGVFFALSMWVYLRKEIDYQYINILVKLIYLGIIITSITTIIAIYNNPFSARILIGNDNPDEVRRLLRLNIGSYSFHYMLAIVSPVFIYLFKSTKKFMWLLALIVSGLSILYAQIVAIVMIYLLNTFITLMIVRGYSIYTYWVFWILGISALLFGNELVSQLLYLASHILNDFEMIATKFNEVAFYIESGGNVDYYSTENVYAYQMRYNISEEAFLEQPLFGGSGESGGHHFWIDNLAEHGILGTIPWLFVFIAFYKSFKRLFYYEERILIINTIMIFIIIGINKNILIYTMPVYPLFIVPLFLLYNRYNIIHNAK